MLEDIRTHTPVPTQQEVEWMAARPGRAVMYVSVLGILALAIANGIFDAGALPAAPSLAAAAPHLAGGGQ